MLRPLRHRDFRLLWAGTFVSLLGDGAFLVAMAWEVYALTDAPTALSIVGIAMTVPTIVFLLVGGVVSDRFDRRRVMLCADGVRGVAVAALAVLAATGLVALWQIVVIVAVYGAGQAFFDPSFDALVPEVLPRHELAPANALDQVARPLALRLAGPALGGVLVAAAGAGAAFALDAATFAVSAAMLVAMTRRPRLTLVSGPTPAAARRSMRADVAEGLAYVRAHAWLWVTFAAAAVAYLLFMGPTEVLVPYLVKNDLHGDAADLGLVFAAGGLGSIACAMAMARRALPRATIVFTYVVWALATLAVAGYGLSHAIWQLMVVSVAFNALETAGLIVWATARQRHVRPELLGRVSSLEWLITIGLLPLSFGLTGPVVAAIGARATLIGAGVLGAAVTLGALAVPHVREVDGSQPLDGDERPRAQPVRVLAEQRH